MQLYIYYVHFLCARVCCVYVHVHMHAHAHVDSGGVFFGRGSFWGASIKIIIGSVATFRRRRGESSSWTWGCQHSLLLLLG